MTMNLPLAPVDTQGRDERNVPRVRVWGRISRIPSYTRARSVAVVKLVRQSINLESFHEIPHQLASKLIKKT